MYEELAQSQNATFNIPHGFLRGATRIWHLVIDMICQTFGEDVFNTRSDFCSAEIKKPRSLC